MSAPYAKLPGWADYGLIPVINLIVIQALDLTSKKAIGTAAGFIGLLGYAGKTVESKGFGVMLDRLIASQGEAAAWHTVIATIVGSSVIAMLLLEGVALIGAVVMGAVVSGWRGVVSTTAACTLLLAYELLRGLPAILYDDLPEPINAWNPSRIRRRASPKMASRVWRRLSAAESR